MKTLERKKISISASEYHRLKRLDECVGGFFQYLDHLNDIRVARKEVENGKTVSQIELFKRLGI